MIFFWYLHSRAVINKGEHVISKVSYMFIKMLSQIWIWKDNNINVVYQPNWSTHLIYYIHSFHIGIGFFVLYVLLLIFILSYFILFYFILFYFILFYFIFYFLFFLLSYFLMWSLCFVYALVCYRKSLTGTNMIVKTSAIFHKWELQNDIS